ncbi:MAG TPA: TonB-dependent receptor [Thermoanaerobaculia bacterium]|nr:TonB-dependent receptor [Thermoanaerobaculia bacterium]
MRVRTLVLSAMCALLLALPVLSQGIPTGVLSGKVSAQDGSALPGVLVSVTSPALQGTRTVTTSESGDYNVPLLPPGDYSISYELEGFLSPQQTVKISAQQTTRIDVEMAQASVSEEIVVTGTYETISTSATAATTYEKEFVEQLPMERNIRETVLLTPGASASGPASNARNGGISISGSQSYENLFLVNGVVITENLRGQPFDLFIEDAVEETTTSVSGVSAEYGRFAGGVVNTITKSGGNEIHGTFRDSLTNQDWESATPLTREQTDEINNRYEATLGGWIWKDKVWYFLAGRDFEQLTTGQTTRTLESFDRGQDQQRYEGKLTLSPLTGHRLTGSYIKIDEDELGNFFGTILDTRSINDRSLPQELTAFNYSGVLTENFFIEAQYSEREFTFENAGSKFTDRIFGTLLVDSVTGERWWSPTFCGVCRPEERDNENMLAKASWFLSTDSLGSHDVAFGYDTFEDIRAADNHQSGSDFRILISNTILRNGELFPQLISGSTSTFIQYNPILESSLGTSFVTNSFFVNDRWRFNDHWSFNLGLRYDQNDGEDASRQKVADDSKLSPRLSATFDPKGDGDWIFNASYAEYVAALASTQANGTAQGGNPAAITWFWRGPSINADPNAPNLLGPEEALAAIFNWFDSEGGVNNTTNLRSLNIPGATTVINGSLLSPSTTEYVLGAAKRLGTKGIFRADYVHREGHDFYVNRTDLGTGSTVTPSGQRANITFIENEDSLLERVYDGIHTQIQVRPSDRWFFGGNYTWSHSRGNFDGETQPNGPVASGILQFPEYKDLSWNNPRGDLGVDQRHRARLWAVYNIFTTDRHNLNVSLLQSYASGTPYGAVGGVDTRFSATTNPTGVVNPGYAIPPASVAYFFTDRDAFRTDDLSATDLSFNYGFTFNTFGKELEIYLQPEVLNLFDEQGVGFVNTAVQDATTTAGLQRFDPFTTEPIEGVHWRKGTNFGKATNELHYQQPRMFRLSLGFRF